MKRFGLLAVPARIAICAAALGGSSMILAQETVPVTPAPVVAPTPVAAPPAAAPVATPVTPAPTASDTIAPRALADIAVEMAEERAAAKPAPRAAAVKPVARSKPAVSEVRPARSAAPAVAAAPLASVAEAPEPAVTPTADIAPVANAVEPAVVEPIASDIIEPQASEAPVAPAGNDWMIFAALAGVLGLGGLAAFIAARRRRVREDEPRVVEVNRVEPAAPAPETPSILTAPVFAERPEPRVNRPMAQPVTAPVSTVPITDPMFSRPVAVPAVTDPLFAKKVTPGPVTDPLFANRDDYQGRTANPRRARELEPAE